MSPRRRPPTLSSRAVVSLALSLVCVLALGGVTAWLVTSRLGGPDDETAPPPRTTATASTGPTGPAAPVVTDRVPRRIPSATGTLRPDDAARPVWVEGAVLHVGTRSWDLTPRVVDSFVPVRGGIYFLDAGRLWTTDTAVVRDTGVGGPDRPASDLVTDRDGRHVRVTVAGRQHAWDVRTGRAVPPASVVPVRVDDLLGTPVRVRVRPLRDNAPPDPAAAARLGPGGARGYGVVVSATRPLDPFALQGRRRVAPSGVVGDGFELVRWTGPGRMWGVALSDGSPLAILSCDLAVGRCRSLGTLSGRGTLLLGGPE